MRASTKRIHLTLTAAALSAAAGCYAPPDGVLSIAFSLDPPPPAETRTLPPASEIGVPPLAWQSAHGTCTCDVVAANLACSFKGLPIPPAAPEGPRTYHLLLLVGPQPLGARFDGRAIDRDPGGHDPDGPPLPEKAATPRVDMGLVGPDELGLGALSLSLPGKSLDTIVGGELVLVVPGATGSTSYVVIDGRVGNLVGAGETAAPAPTAAPSGHHH